jgi:hypothetical protein
VPLKEGERGRERECQMNDSHFIHGVTKRERRREREEEEEERAQVGECVLGRGKYLEEFVDVIPDVSICQLVLKGFVVGVVRSRQKLYPIDRLCTLVCTVFRSFARAVFAEA